MKRSYELLEADRVVEAREPDFRIAQHLAERLQKPELERLEKEVYNHPEKRLKDKSKSKTTTSAKPDEVPERFFKESEVRLSKAIQAILKHLETLSKDQPQDVPGREEKAAVLALGTLVSANRFAWHIARSKLKDEMPITTLQYLATLRQKFKDTQDENSAESVYLATSSAYVDDLHTGMLNVNYDYFPASDIFK